MLIHSLRGSTSRCIVVCSFNRYVPDLEVDDAGVAVDTVSFIEK